MARGPSTLGGADWPLRGFVVKVGDAVRGYLNRCPQLTRSISCAGCSLTPLEVRCGFVLLADSVGTAARGAAGAERASLK